MSESARLNLHLVLLLLLAAVYGYALLQMQRQLVDLNERLDAVTAPTLVPPVPVVGQEGDVST